MTNDTPVQPRATVLRFTLPVTEREPASPAAVHRLQQSALTRQMLSSLAVRDIALAVHEADRFVDQAPADLPFEHVTPEYAETVLDRSAVAMHLGDQVKRAVATEHAAVAILRGIHHGMQTGTIAATSPLARVDLATARLLAKLAMHGGLEYLAGRPRT